MERTITTVAVLVYRELKKVPETRERYSRHYTIEQAQNDVWELQAQGYQAWYERES